MDSVTRARFVRQPKGDTTRTARAPRAVAGGGEEHSVDSSTDMFGDVSPTTRLQMELIARSTSNPAEALTAMITLIVEGSPHKRAAIVTAISENDPLREQWERTWAVLRR